MAFPAHERTILLAVRGVGPTVARRLEEPGVEDLRSCWASPFANGSNRRLENRPHPMPRYSED